MRVENCKFIDNREQSGAFYVDRFTDCTLVDCYFSGNNATTAGGAVYGSGSYLNIENCIFEDNYAPYGGAVYLTGNNNEITGSAFNGNSANYGSAIYNNGRLTVSDSEMFDNKANSDALTINVVVDDSNVTVTARS